MRFGNNDGRNPIPAEHTNPLLGAISEHHLTLGLSRRLDNEWNITGSLECVRSGTVTYTNPELPFGPNSTLADDYLG